MLISGFLHEQNIYLFNPFVWIAHYDRDNNNKKTQNGKIPGQEIHFL